ncbi:MAG: DUF5654 family protein [archaeon]|nr:DUF5654 family protein [archaeon]
MALKRDVASKLAVLITSAFGLVAALAWNGAIKAIFVEFFGTASTLVPMIVYAFVVAIVAVLATIWIGRIAEKAK